MKTVFIPEAANSKWDNVEVYPVFDDGNGNCEPCDEGEESFWSVYLHQKDGGIVCVADLPTKELAYQFSELLENAVKSHTVWDV